jgi:UDP-N-acetylmuramoyl-tripeptide--D-alanyl-D-alanine ligase
MIRGIASLYSWRYPTVLVYMLQNAEYQPGAYLQWFWRTSNFNTVTYRRELELTGTARMLRLALYAGMAVQLLAGALLLWLWYTGQFSYGLPAGALLILLYPHIWAHLIVLPLVIGRWLIIKPRQRRAIEASKQIFHNFEGTTIAIAGSYGKTSMKELLLTVLQEGRKVAATPANKNVSISHALFAKKLSGDEDILLIEYGEGAPGDVRRFTDITKPTHAVITGLAAAHLDKYKTVEAAGEDIFSLQQSVPANHIYVNGESPQAVAFVQPDNVVYTQEGVLGWRVSGIATRIDGTQFVMQKGKEKMELASGLLGRHQVGPLALAAALARELGLKPAEIAAGIAKTKPYEHRMEPRQLAGAWIIDDTYNGNIEGIKVGTQLLKELPGKRKIYVTPGLVDQGADSQAIHIEMGKLIAGANPDIVVLMEHSVTPDIQAGLEAAGFKGKVMVEDDPLAFYTNLNLFVAAGDVVVMQNDWPDNYA